MLSRARRRRLAAHSATCVAGVALAAAPAATAADLDITALPLALQPLPAEPSGGLAPVAAPAAPLATASGRCRGAGALAGRTSSATMRWALLCLINHRRARHGRGGFGADARLMRAANRHAADMARRHYFSHVSPGGASPLRRARSAGWRGGVAEAIAWGCGTRSSPRATVQAWLASPPHRAIVLGRGGAAGIGFKRAAGCGGRGYWVLDVG